MSDILDRIQAKITRAKQHLRDFELDLVKFCGTEPCRIGAAEDSTTGKRTYCLTKIDSVPDSLVTIAADVISNLRSPLDQIVYQLILDARNGVDPDWPVYYPISASAANYPATRKGNIKDVRQEIVDAIDATEPYKGGKGHNLWQLNELNKPDKHKLMFTAGVYNSGIDVTGDFFTRLGIKGVPSLFCAPAHRVIASRIGHPVLVEPLNVEMDKGRKFVFDVSFNVPGVIECEPALRTLQNFTNLVDGIIANLGRYLP